MSIRDSGTSYLANVKIVHMQCTFFSGTIHSSSTEVWDILPSIILNKKNKIKICHHKKNLFIEIMTEKINALALNHWSKPS